MIHPNHILTVTACEYDMVLSRFYASRCEIGGHSHIRNGQNRQDELSNDQFIGQLGECVGTRVLFGGRQLYRLGRWFKDLSPTKGDGGSDVPGTNIDFKTSKMRASQDPLSYNLLVRPDERHSGTIYILVLVHHTPSDEAKIHLVGWLDDSELPSAPESAGIFRGAHKVAARDLHPLMPIQWYC